MYDDRLEIWSDGTLPFGLRVEHLKRDHQSRPYGTSTGNSTGNRNRSTIAVAGYYRSAVRSSSLGYGTRRPLSS
ncbi:hypothetical protein MYX82_07870 [Acidobacteria bacterium AH-259-D05]|nr:hypothetical protein [Acidobacteria bacterium AH-259-D05]